MFSCYDTMIRLLKHKIKLLEKTIREPLYGNGKLWAAFELITTIKGIGLIVAAHLIVYICNFIRFDNWRKFACCSGTAPFDYQSGPVSETEPRWARLPTDRWRSCCLRWLFVRYIPIQRSERIISAGWTKGKAGWQSSILSKTSSWPESLPLLREGLRLLTLKSCGLAIFDSERQIAHNALIIRWQVAICL